ncbi:MAG: hypothetical protein ACP5SB_03205 [Caldisericaceae bacterium]
MGQFFTGTYFSEIPVFVFGVWGGVLLVELILAISTAVVAAHKGRNGFGWFLIGLFTGIVGLAIILVALPKRYYFDEEE